MPSEITLGTMVGTNFLIGLTWLRLVCELYNTNLSIWHILFCLLFVKLDARLRELANL